MLRSMNDCFGIIGGGLRGARRERERERSVERVESGEF